MVNTGENLPRGQWITLHKERGVEVSDLAPCRHAHSPPPAEIEAFATKVTRFDYINNSYYLMIF